MYLKSRSSDKRLELRGQVVAGRNEDCDLVLSQGHPSRRHAQITVNDDGAWIEDLGSTNGTFVNDQKVEASTRLQAGDRVRFDAEEFDVVDTAAAAAPAPDPNATVLRSPVDLAPRESPPAAEPPKAAEREPAAEPPTAAAPSPERPPEPAGPAAAEPPRPATPAPERPAEPPRPAPPPPAAPAEAAPNTREVEGTSAGARRPGAWADPNQVKEGGTVLYNPEQLQALLAEAKPSPQPLADADAPYLVVTAGAQAGSTIKLKAGAQANVWDVGRDAGRDIRFDEDGVSGFHAKIVNEGARWKVIDQMSANGTLVNEKRGTISFLSAGDRIRFGPVECVFQLPSGSTGRQAGGGVATKSSPLIWVGVAVAVVVVLVVAALLLL